MNQNEVYKKYQTDTSEAQMEYRRSLVKLNEQMRLAVEALDNKLTQIKKEYKDWRLS